MRLLGPSPLMSSGWVAEHDSQIQHVREVIGPEADVAAEELHDLDEGHPRSSTRRRLVRKVPLDPRPLEDAVELPGVIACPLAGSEDSNPVVESHPPEHPRPEDLPEQSSSLMGTCSCCGLTQQRREVPETEAVRPAALSEGSTPYESAAQSKQRCHLRGGDAWSCNLENLEAIQEEEIFQHSQLKKLWSQRIGKIPSHEEESGRSPSWQVAWQDRGPAPFAGVQLGGKPAGVGASSVGSAGRGVGGGTATAEACDRVANLHGIPAPIKRAGEMESSTVGRIHLVGAHHPGDQAHHSGASQG